ncbi:family 43 glycosylhydrolase [Draconibacterium mangrovi]|uniref:family 43 glycosylhydrolase n=1 Tax=Draconibacterium mangrovi TaxID=2697469 RepID=UPI0013D55149|nr:family 43 glycosylhydrolase [Draconibacterium mangrovi]
MNQKLIFVLFVCASFMTFLSCAQNLEVNRSSRYCNPLPMILGPGGNAAGDVTVIRENGTYYMYCTGGGAWYSKDMMNWSFQTVANVPVAPDVTKYNGKFYMCGNDCPLYIADDPLGPFTVLGDWKNTPDVAGGWNGAFDVDIFIDDDNKPYLYYSGKGVSGIYVVELDPNDLTSFSSPVKHLIEFNNEHVWERYGESNEYPDVAWIEGPWMQKHNGIYYLQYSASGTQWKTYASGYYTSKSPTGPFTYAPNNPLLRKTEGLVTGTAHGSIVEGPDGNLWQFYTIVLSDPPGGRRIGMDRIVFDENGNMSVKITDTPQWAPDFKTDSQKEDCGSLPLTINKVNAWNALSKFSSEQDGRYASYAVDNFSGTWWEPKPNDVEPSITIELSPATEFDVVQLFTIDGLRLMFNQDWRTIERLREDPPSYIYQYKIEVSLDGKNYLTAFDQTSNNISKNTIYEEIPPIECRFVRLTITDWPKTSPLKLNEFTIFGKASGFLPAQESIPGKQ